MTAAEQTAAPPDSRAPDGTTDVDGTASPHLPGEMSMWVFVLGDMIIFAVYFIIYMVERSKEPAVFLASQQHLNQNVGLINTLLMLASSWFVARGVLASRAGDHDRAIRLTVGGGLCGVVFILIKVYEWTSEIRHGYTLPHNEFFTFYFMLTGVHLLHVVLGLIILGIVVRELRDPTLRRPSMIESGGIYWHMVDLLWIVIFALLYVMR